MPESEQDPLLGVVLNDRYEILAPLGEGGMGAVYRGEHALIGRQVAIKVLNPALAASPDFAKRFQREAMAAGRLDHPNCVPVTDSGQLEDGTVYIVMELVDGESLRDLIDREAPLHPVRALRIARHVLRGLGHAHEAGIIHRDIKPDNIMLSPVEDDRDLARVLDFGIAKLRDGESGEALTQAGMAVGTPAYLSPEQAVGGDVDLRTDLYSTTAMLFEMLCARPPFVGSTPIKTLSKHTTAPIPHLWEHADHLGAFPQLDALIQKGLAKDAEDRYADSSSYVAAIDQVLLSMGAHFTPSHGIELTPPAPETPPPAPHAPIPHPTPAPLPQTGEVALPHTGEIETTYIAPAASPGHHGNTGSRGRAIAVGSLLCLGLFAAVVLSTSLGGGSGAGGLDPEQAFKDTMAQLKKGKSCEERLEAVRTLRLLGDKRAIPALKKVRSRMRGGVLGVGGKNTNKCLKDEANEAIKALEALP